MKINVSMLTEISDAQVESIVNNYLNKFKNGRWVDGDNLMEEAYTSHRYDSRVGGRDHPDYELVRTIQTLQRLLQERKKKA